MPSASKYSGGPLGRALLLGLLVFGVITGLSCTNFGQNLENRALDFGYALRPVSPPPPELLIVGIDEASFQELKHRWPWPRYFHATLVKRLSEAGAHLIIFDALFADPATPEEDRVFAEAIRQAGNVILASTFEKFESPSLLRRSLVEPQEIFSKAACGVALFMVTPDPDGVVRRFRLRLGGRDTLPALVARVLRPQRMLAPDLCGLINFIGPPGSFETVSYYQLLDPEQKFPTAKIRDRIVLIGQMTASSIDPMAHIDNFSTPFFRGGRLAMAGVEMHGNIVTTVLREKWGSELQPVLILALYLILMLAFSLLITRLSPFIGLVVLLGFLAFLWFASLTLFLMYNVWIPPVLAMIGMSTIYTSQALRHLLLEAREKRWLRQAFSRYVSPAVVEVIAEHPERLELGGEEVDATILFADLADFTALAEKMPPREIIHLLDEYFTTMTQIVLTHKGTVDKYIGDAIMCFWGAPIPQPDHGIRACRAALDMQKAMSRLNESWLSVGHPSLSLRIGLHSGNVVAGNVGSRDRFNYTVMGDAVNLAHRLERVNRFYGSKILLSEATHSQVKESFMIRELDHILVKGRTQPVTLYELLGYLPPKGAPYPGLDLFADGLAAYRHKNWAQAREKFQQVLHLNPYDTPARLYLERSTQFLEELPPAT